MQLANSPALFFFSFFFVHLVRSFIRRIRSRFFVFPLVPANDGVRLVAFSCTFFTLLFRLARPSLRSGAPKTRFRTLARRRAFAAAYIEMKWGALILLCSEKNLKIIGREFSGHGYLSNSIGNSA